MQLKIGELASRAGLSVRALHHYDAVGLLSPSARSPAGARLYAQSDIVRLHRIQALKQMGYSLPDIREALRDTSVQPVETIQKQISALEAQASKARKLSVSLKHLVKQIEIRGELQGSDWLDILELMTIYKKHLTDEEMDTIHRPNLDMQWARLVAEVKQAMYSQLTTDSQEAQSMAWRWVRLVIAKSNNNAALACKLKAMQEREVRAQDILGITPSMFDWIGQTIVHARTAIFAKYLSPKQTNEIKRIQLTAMTHMDEWPQLVALVRKKLDEGVAVDAKPMQVLAVRWQQLFRHSFCGDNKALEIKVRKAFAKEPDLNLGVGVDEALIRYVHEAITHLKETS
jgi:DNA-binding transcriptional MerR regulator